jgi:tetraacyldisaccharide 4'-kinase
MQRTLEKIWWNQAGLERALLLPFLIPVSWGYRLGLAVDQFAKKARRRQLPRPVLSVGNLTVGGTGKTPITLWMAQQVEALGAKPCILSRGYGAKNEGPVRVDPESENWQAFGDEPLLLARGLESGSVYIGRNRAEAGFLALEKEPDIDLFLLDDGFQHLALDREFDLVLVDAGKHFGNGRLLPAGPLREPLSHLRRASAIGLVSKTLQPATRPGTLPERFSPLPLALHPTGWKTLGEKELKPLQTLPKDRPVRLLTGIASPESFLATAKEVGLDIGSTAFYPDHHPFTREEISRQSTKASHLGQNLVTTAKDAVRLNGMKELWTNCEKPFTIEVGLTVGDGAETLKAVLSHLLEKGSDSLLQHETTRNSSRGESIDEVQH